MSSGKKSISIDLDAETEQLLRVAVALSGVSLKTFCVAAVEEKVEKTVFPSGPIPTFTEESVQKLIALRDEISQGSVSSTDSVDLIREARKRRSKRQEELGCS